MSQFDEEKIDRKIDALRIKEEEDSMKLLSQKYGLPYADFSKMPIELDTLKILPEDRARYGDLALIQATGKTLKIGVHNPTKEETKAVLLKLERDNFHYDLFLVSRHSLEHAWSYYKKIPAEHDITAGAVAVSHERIEQALKEIETVSDLKNRITETFAGHTTDLLEIILAGALAVDASDVHIEPESAQVRLRYRMDGVLHDIIFMPTPVFTHLLSRIKLIAEMKLNVHDQGQDGRFTIKTGGADIEVRASILPGPYGENIVLRVLNPKAISITIEGLGMQPWVAELMETELKKTNGMILTTGPTGSGKTTTLYAFLRKIHSPSIKIITIEDPIEYHIEGIEQTQVDSEKGYDFANGLRSIVRQDPDAILVGEIRDLETAETGMHAALTGHLVFSTLHTNNAAGTIPRLIDLGVKPPVIAPAVNVAMAQRLVRKLCPDCKKPKKFSAEEEKNLRHELSAFPKGAPTPPKEKWTVFEAFSEGCQECHHIGYKGRLGVYEVIQINETIEHLILGNPSEFDIKKEQEKQGQINLRQDGLLKMLAGITDITELNRVIGN